MSLFKRNTVAKDNFSENELKTTPARWAPPAAPGVPDLSAELQRQLQTARARVFTYSDLVKQVDCVRCGAPKQLPTKTAYVYCDHCGALTDYDFRVGNFATNAALTNQVFAFLVGPVQPALDVCSATGDSERYRSLLRPVFAEWVRQCPQANSPRATSDPDFYARTVNYLVESSLARDLDAGARQLGRQLAAATMALRRIPQPDGTWRVGDGFWPVATLFKQQIEASYQACEARGVLALDPEQAPLSVWLRMEFSYFCQDWLPKLAPADADRLLDFFGLKNEYAKMTVATPETRQCGRCGDELRTVPGAQAVVCESCGSKLDIAGGEVPCRTCGARLSFPVGVSEVQCPYCHTATRRT
jgi:LSD1 subclass zinc finger protein